jgi:hypothetical protein
MLRQHDSHFDASRVGSPTVGDRSTRFDQEATKDAHLRQEIDRKQEVC